MRRRILALAVAASLVALVPAGATRLRRLHEPPARIPLWSSLAVNEGEWYINPSHRQLRHGRIRINIYNLGMDAHDLTIADASGRVLAHLQVGAASNRPSTGVLTTNLPAGRYTFYCSLYANTPQSHVTKGMITYLTVG
jgi:hypothetical protein